MFLNVVFSRMCVCKRWKAHLRNGSGWIFVCHDLNVAHVRNARFKRFACF